MKGKMTPSRFWVHLFSEMLNALICCPGFVVVAVASAFL